MDDRVAKVLSNSRFKKVKKSKKTVLDSRFSSLFTDPRFTVRQLIDKRGNAVTKKNNALSEMYDIDEKTEEILNNIPTDEKPADDSDSESSYCINEENIDNVDIYDELNTGDQKYTDESTTRLALCNLDWKKMDATDIFALVSSLCSNKTDIISVKVYLSDFGAKELAYEALNGPLLEDDPTASEHADNIPNTTEGETKIDSVNVIKLKKYFLKRLKYYFAVITCADKEIAQKLYEAGDSLEIEHSSVKLDLSFIPNDVEFANDPTSTCSSVPEDFIPHEFVLSAFQKTNVDLEWDETDSKRLLITQKKSFTEKDLENLELMEKYLAPPSDEETDQEAEKSSEDKIIPSRRDKYKDLLKTEKEDSDTEMAENDVLISWNNDLEEIESHAKTTSKPNTKFKRETKSNITFDDPFLTTKPPSLKQNKTKQDSSVVSEIKESKSDEYDLLTFDPSAKTRSHHFDYRDGSTNSTKSKKAKEGNEQDDDFKMNIEDKRFTAMFESPLYALDPSNSNFKKSKNMNNLLKVQTVKRHANRLKNFK